MRAWILWGIIIVTIIISSMTILFVTPYYVYYRVINNKLETNWFSIERYTPLYHRPNEKALSPPTKTANEQFWRKFNFGDFYLPLPVRNPFYFTIPNLKYSKQSQQTQVGLTLLDGSGDKIFHIYLLPQRPFPTLLNAQKIFELPLVRKEITKKNNAQIWKDLFTRQTKKWDISFSEMFYNLYLLELRSKILPANLKSFGLISNMQKALIELSYPNKDYEAQLILNQRGDKIFSFIVVTRKNNQEAKLIRHKMINEIEFVQSTPQLADIIIKEFKGLNYQDQIDHEGMLYLLSAWSHDHSRREILEKIIFYLERGRLNQKQLAPVYQYLFQRYGEVVSYRVVKNLDVDNELKLQINMALEKQKEESNLTPNINMKPTPQPSVQQEFDQMIEESKIPKIKKRKTLRID